jgi:uncharacterized protein
MTSPNVLVDLRDLSLRAGERYERNFPLEVAPVLLGGVRYDVLLSNGVDVRVDRVAGGFLTGVSTEATIYGPCCRCLREVVLTIRADEQEFIPSSKDGWDETELSAFVADMIVDVSGMAREAIVLATPPRILCRDECAGLCAQCGKDLNEGPCGCPAPELDDRWAKLKDFKGSNTIAP